MGPTNVALVKLFRADQALRESQERLDAASKNVRVQDRRVNDLAEKLRLAQTALREAQSRAKQLELDQGSRDTHIEKLRTQQQVAKNHKEYQAFLMEINTQKVDRAKIEDDQMKAEEALDKAKAEVTGLTAQADAERAKLAALKEQIGGTLASHHAEVDSLRPAREAAAAAIPVRIRETFERLAEHHDGEALSAISKPDRRREEYLCTACNMELARDVYNKLHTRDDIIYCPSCRRILYIPDDLPPEEAIGSGRPAPKVTKASGPRKVRTAKAKPGAKGPGTPAAEAAGSAGEASDASDVVIEPRAKGKLGQALSRAQGETVSSAIAGGQNPVEFEVYVDGEMAGIYKGQSPEKLTNAIKWYMSQAKLEGTVEVKPLPTEEPTTESASPVAPAPIAPVPIAPAPVAPATPSADAPAGLQDQPPWQPVAKESTTEAPVAIVEAKSTASAPVEADSPAADLTASNEPVSLETGPTQAEPATKG